MLCPKCKKEIEENSLRCDFCGTKVGSLCKKCGSYNMITAPTCSNCGNELLKICTECGAANLPDSEFCRKCKIEFVSLKDAISTTFSTSHVNLNNQQKIKEKFVEGIKDSDFRVITIGGESGVGKNLVLRSGINELKNAKLIWMFGSCTQITQLSPFGYFQDVLLTFFNINNFCSDTLQLKKNSIKFFKQDFPTLTNNEILDLLNLLYPENIDKYENIYFNKAKMFSIVKKVISTIVEKMKIVFIVDNYDLIDGMSYDFLKELLKDEDIFDRIKVVFLTRNQKPGLGIITSPLLKDENYLDLNLGAFTSTQVESFFKQYSDLKFGKDFTNLATKISGGNPARLEQIVLLNRDAKRLAKKDVVYNSFDAIMKQRLFYLKTEDINSYRALIAISVLGAKFYPAMLENFDNNPVSEFERIIESLVDKGFITQLNNLTFEFKSEEIWKIIVSHIKSESCFEEVLDSLYEILSRYKQSSIALLGYIVQKLNNNDKSFEIWTQLMRQSAYIGDIGLYIISQKQALLLIENKTSLHYQKIKKNIYTRVGKLLEPIDANQAFEFLQNAIMMLEDYEDAEHIDLLGYFASCAMKTGNYCGVIECIDNVLNKLSDNNKFEKILIKSRQINPLLKLGNYGQLINCMETELLPEIERVLAKGRDLPVIRLQDLFELWLNLYFNFAEALVFQGNNKSFDVIQNIYDIIDKNKVTEPSILCKANLLLALANTIKGDTNLSTKILDDMLKEFALDNMDEFIISRWNFIDVLNKFFDKNYSTLYNELFNVASYANNINDNFTKNILKTLLAKMLKENNQVKKSLEILEEQVAYFAKEKVATGVLLSWYLIAEIKLITNGTQFALDIATKALDIAQGASINNYYFTALFNKLIAEIYLAKQDFESSKVYFEKAITIAKQFDLQSVLIETYLQSAKLYQELAMPKSSMRGDYIRKALKMFQLAKNVPIVAEHNSIQRRIKEELNILTSFCKLNGIVLKRESK